MLVEEKVRLTNRITAALKGYYPQVLEWFADKDTQIFGSIGFCMQMFIANILGLYDRAESSENSLSPAKPA